MSNPSVEQVEPEAVGRRASPLTAVRRILSMDAGQAFASLARSTLELIYPPSCIHCTSATAEPHGLCPTCWSRIGFIARPFCERLGTPFEVDYGGPLLSPAAIADPPVFGRARSAARHDAIARDLVHGLKYGDKPELALMLGRLTAQAGAELLCDADLILPIPLHRGRLWSRRFNQAALLADVIGAQSGVPVDPFVVARVKRTLPQVGLTRSQRARNLQGAFHVSDEGRIGIAGKHLLLIDDVFTTGATLNAAARVLLRAGAAGVDVLTFARVLPQT